MKLRVLVLAIAMLCSCSGFSAIINVDNNPNRPSGYYSSLPLAINAASPDDTLYVYPSNTSYGQITIDKKLHLFGGGFDGIRTEITYVNFDTSSTNSTNSSGSTIQGMSINYIQCQKPNIANIVVSGNIFEAASSCITLKSNCSGWLISNNSINGYIDLYNNSPIIISNNIFQGGTDYPVYRSNSSSNVFSHNLVMKFQYFNNVFNMTITDNIFICENANQSTYNHSNRYYNNISWRSALNPYVIPTEGSTGSGNFSNQDPQFETATASGNFDLTKDYHLKATSPGKNAATDGTDIGPYGGSKPFVWGGGMSIPQITETLITNPVINQTTPLNVNVKGRSAEY